MPTKREHKSPGVQVTQYEPDAPYCCNFRLEGRNAECGKPAVTALMFNENRTHIVLLKLCRRHLCRLTILLVKGLE